MSEIFKAEFSGTDVRIWVKGKIIKDWKIFKFPMFLVEVKEHTYVKILQYTGLILRLFLPKNHLYL